MYTTKDDPCNTTIQVKGPNLSKLQTSPCITNIVSPKGPSMQQQHTTSGAKVVKIQTLMYLTSSRPDLVQAVCYCARYQARPTQKHLKEVKRNFKYLKGTINMGLWYLKDSGFELTAFSDADHADALTLGKALLEGYSSLVISYQKLIPLADICLQKPILMIQFKYLVRRLVRTVVTVSQSTKVDSLPHVHAHSTKTIYHESSRFKDKDFRKL
ncbi:hypothetical protein Tco_1317982 [Tanacetum coccineum]